MAATVNYRLGANGTPTDFTSPIGGAINLTTTLDVSGNVDGVFSSSENVNPSTDVTYYSIFYISLESANVLAQARFFNSAGAVTNPTAGLASIVSSSASDVGTVVYVTGLVGGLWVTDSLTSNGTTPVYGTSSFDANSVRRWEWGLGNTKPVGNISCFVNAGQCALIYGGINSFASAEYTYALATAKNTTLSSANQITAPTGISAFLPATNWSGSDASITVPTTGAMVQNDYIGVVQAKLLKANIPTPKSGRMKPNYNLLATQTS